MSVRKKDPAPDPAIFKTATELLQLGERLKELRKAKDYAITTLAKISGVAPNTIRAIERGKPAHRSSVYRVIDALNASPLPITDETLLKEDIEVARAYHHAPTRSRNFIAQFLRSGDYLNYRGPDAATTIMVDDAMKLLPEQREAVQSLITFFLSHQKPPASSTGKSPRKIRK